MTGKNKKFLAGAIVIIAWAIGMVGLSTPESKSEEVVKPKPVKLDLNGNSASRLPGAEPHDGDLRKRIEEMTVKRGSDYKPRTRHLRSNGDAKYSNRLFLESSPYLLQHAHNPVNWYSWGDEAFKAAKRLNRPILLSVGYSTCHWCHVMEEESFEDKEIARFMNENYITRCASLGR